MLLAFAEALEKELADCKVDTCEFCDDVSLHRDLLEPLHRFASSFLVDDESIGPVEFLDALLPALKSNRHHVVSQYSTILSSERFRQRISCIDTGAQDPAAVSAKQKLDGQSFLKQVLDKLTAEEVEFVKSRDIGEQVGAAAEGKMVDKPILLAWQVMGHLALFEASKGSLSEDPGDKAASEQTKKPQSKLFLSNGTTMEKNVTLTRSVLQQCGISESISMETLSVYYQGCDCTVFVGYSESEIVSLTVPVDGSPLVHRFEVPESYRPVYAGHGHFRAMGLVLLFSESRQSYGLCVVERDQRVPIFDVLYFDESFDLPLFCVFDTNDSGFCVVFNDIRDAHCFERVDRKLVRTGRTMLSPFCKNEKWLSFVSGNDVCAMNQALLKIQCDFIMHQLAQHSDRCVMRFMEMCVTQVTALESFGDMEEILAFLDTICTKYTSSLGSFLTLCSVWMGINVSIVYATQEQGQKHDDTAKKTVMQSLLRFYERVADLAPEAHEAILFALSLQSEDFIGVGKEQYVKLVESLMSHGNLYCSLVVFALSTGFDSLGNYASYFDLLSTNCPVDLAMWAITVQLYFSMCQVQEGDTSAFQDAAIRWLKSNLDQGVQLPVTLGPYLWTMRKSSDLIPELAIAQLQSANSQICKTSCRDLLVYHILLAGEYLRENLLKFPSDEDERSFQIVLDSNILKIDATVENEVDSISLVKRTLSMGLSFSLETESNPYDRAMLSGFLRELVEPAGTAQLANTLENFLIKKFKEPTERVLGDTLKRLRRLTAAVLIKHLGCTERALDLALALSDGDMEAPISGAVKLAWDESNRFVRDIKRRCQMGMSLDEVLPRYEEKLKFLLSKEPVIRILISDLEMDDLAKTKRDVVTKIFTFVKCEGSVSHIEQILEKRARRCVERQRTLEHILSLKDRLSPKHFTFLMGVLQGTMERIMTHSKLGSLSNDMVRPVNEHLTDYVRFSVQQLCHSNIVDRVCLEVVQCSQFNFMSEEDRCNLVTDALSAITDKTEPCKTLLWYFVIRIAFTHPKNMVEILEKAFSRFSTQEDKDICCFLQAIILHNSQGVATRPQIGDCTVGNDAMLLKTLAVISCCLKQHELIPEGLLTDVVLALLQMISRKQGGDVNLGLKMCYLLMSCPMESKILTDVGKKLILSREYGDDDLLSLFIVFVGSNDITCPRELRVIDPSVWKLESDVLDSLVRLCEKAVPDKFGEYLLKFCCWLASNQDNVTLMSKSNLIDSLNKNPQAHMDVPSLWCCADLASCPVLSHPDDMWTSRILTSEAISLKTKCPRVWELHVSTYGEVWFEVTFKTDIQYFNIGFVLCGDVMPFSGVELSRVNDDVEIRGLDRDVISIPARIGQCGGTFVFGVTSTHFYVCNKVNGEYCKVEHCAQFRYAIPVIAVINTTLDEQELSVVSVSEGSAVLGTEALLCNACVKDDTFDVASFFGMGCYDCKSYFEHTGGNSCHIWVPPGSSCVINDEEWTVSRWLVEGELFTYQLRRGTAVKTLPEYCDTNSVLVQNLRFLRSYAHFFDFYKHVRYLRVLLGMATGMSSGTVLAILELTTVLNPCKAITRSCSETKMCESLTDIWKAQSKNSEFLACLETTIAEGYQNMSMFDKVLVDSPGRSQRRRFIWGFCQDVVAIDLPVGTLQKRTYESLLIANKCMEYCSLGCSYKIVIPDYERASFTTCNGFAILVYTFSRLSSSLLRTISETTIITISQDQLVRYRLIFCLSLHFPDCSKLGDLISSLVPLLGTTALNRLARYVISSCRDSEGPCVCHCTSTWNLPEKQLRYVVAVQKVLALGNSKKFCLGCYLSDVQRSLRDSGGPEELSSKYLSDAKERMTERVIVEVQSYLGCSVSDNQIVEALKRKHQIDEHLGQIIVCLVRVNNARYGFLSKHMARMDLISMISQDPIFAPCGEKHRLVMQGVSVVENVRVITINRAISARSAIDSAFCQLMSQVPLPDVALLRNASDRPWRVGYTGEAGQDEGGLARDFLTFVCAEVFRPDMGLFELTPNGKNGEGPNQTVMIPSFAANLEYLEYVGVLMGLAFWYNLQQDFKFPRLVWKYLTSRQIDVEDICDIDMQFSQLVHMPSIQLDDIQLVDIWGRPRKSDSLARDEKMRLWVAEQTEALAKLLEPMAHGLRRILAGPTGPSVFLPLELELEICGPDTCPLDRFVKLFDVRPPSATSLVHSAFGLLTEEERLLFLGFATGCNRVPPIDSAWKRVVMKINMDRGLPVAHTCSRHIDMREYQEPEELAKDIRLCLEWGCGFGVI